MTKLYSLLASAALFFSFQTADAQVTVNFDAAGFPYSEWTGNVTTATGAANNGSRGIQTAQGATGWVRSDTLEVTSTAQTFTISFRASQSGFSAGPFANISIGVTDILGNSTNLVTMYRLFTTPTLGTGWKSVTLNFPSAGPQMVYINMDADGGTNRIYLDDFSSDADLYVEPILPVRWGNLSAKVAGKAVELDWVTVLEENNDRFEIERSTDGTNFELVGMIGGSGTTSTPIGYHYIDEQAPEGLIYYRLRQVDYDGRSAHSPIVTASLETAFAFKVYPNPLSSSEPASLQLEGVEADQEVLVVLYTSMGDQVYTKVITDGAGGFVSLDRTLPTGVYLVVASSDERIHRERIVVR